MKREAYNHPKMLDLASRLGISRTHACGIVDNLWNWSADVAPQGNIGKWPDGAIAKACDWPGDPSAFIEALSSSGWIDRCDEHRLVIHDLEDHAPEWLKTKLKRTKKLFIKATPISHVTGASARKSGSEHSDPQGVSALLFSALETSTLETSGLPPTPTNEKPKAARTRKAQATYRIGDLLIPTALDSPGFHDAWRRWIDFRATKRKPVSLLGAEESLASLARAGPDVAIQAISDAIRNDWQGLFPERVNSNGNRNRQPSAGQQYRGTELGPV